MLWLSVHAVYYPCRRYSLLRRKDSVCLPVSRASTVDDANEEESVGVAGVFLPAFPPSLLTVTRTLHKLGHAASTAST